MKHIPKYICCILLLLMLFQTNAIAVFASSGNISNVFNGKVEISETPIIDYTESEPYTNISVSISIPEQMLSLKNAYNRTRSFDSYYGTFGPPYMGFQIDMKIDDGKWMADSSWDKMEYKNVPENLGDIFEYDKKIDLETTKSTEEYNFFSTSKIVFDYDSSFLKNVVKKTTENGTDKYALDTKNHKFSFRIRGYVYYNESATERKCFFSEWKELNTNSQTIKEELKKTKNIAIPTEIEKVSVSIKDNKSIINIFLKNSAEYIGCLHKYQVATGKEFFDTKITLIHKELPEDIDTSNLSKKELKEYEEKRQKAIEIYNGPFKIENGKAYEFNTELNEEKQSNVLCIEYNGTITKEEYEDFGIAVEIGGNAEGCIFNKSTEPQSILFYMGEELKDDSGQTVKQNSVVSTVDKCSICGHCSRPLGLCIYIWLVILAVVLVLGTIAMVIIKIQKNKID